jgi:1-acyl-sn-glycerol-3-phosphate acyltransferase
VACNVGVFWPRYGILKKSGTAVIEFLDPIEPGLDKGTFMSRLEDVVETRSQELMRDAGFKFD